MHTHLDTERPSSISNHDFQHTGKTGSVSGKSGKCRGNSRWHPYPSKMWQRDSSGRLKRRDSTVVTGKAGKTTVDKVIECYKKDKLLIRTLYALYHKGRFEKLKWELHELALHKVRRSSSASYIPYKIPMYPLGRIGILLDVEKCCLEGFYTSDAGVSRVDAAGRFISWSRSAGTHVLRSDKSIPVIKPEIRHRVAETGYCTVDSLKDLKAYMQDDYSDHTPVSHNEVVVSYDKDSIIGVAAVLDSESGRGDATNEQILTDSSEFKSIILEEIGVDVPVLIYDCSSGEISAVNT